jgi:hypothetical protein
MLKQLVSLLDKKCVSLWLALTLAGVLIALLVASLDVIRISHALCARNERIIRDQYLMKLFEYKNGFLRIQDKSLIPKRADNVRKLAEEYGFSEDEINGRSKRRQSWNIYE